MADPYWRYGPAAPAAAQPSSSDRGIISKSSFPGYFPTDESSLTNFNSYISSNGLRPASSDFLQKDILPSHPGGFGVHEIGGIRSQPDVSGLTAGASIRSYPPLFEDPNLLVPQRDVASDTGGGIRFERPNSTSRPNGPPGAAGESNVLFVDGLPSDCTRREIGHLFRPFIGFRELRVVHKEPRRRGDKAMVLCFVEFNDAKCALTAMEALQGYKFDDKKPESSTLRIHFAHFPFRVPSDRDEPHLGSMQRPSGESHVLRV